MRRYLSEYFYKERTARHLSYRDVARMLGFRNEAIGIRKIIDFETEGIINKKFLVALVDGIGLDKETVKECLKKEREEFNRDISEWSKRSYRMTVVIRVFRSCYLRKDVPEKYVTENEGLNYSVNLAREKKVKVCFKPDRYKSVWINEFGRICSITYERSFCLNRGTADLKKDKFIA